MSSHETVVAIYEDFETANNALQALLDVGFLRGDLGVAVSDPHGVYCPFDFQFKRTEETDEDDNGFDDLLSSLLADTTFTLSSVLIPGIGPVVASGSLADVLSESVSVVVGGVTASLVHLGIPQNEAGYYAEALQQGYALLTINVRTERAMEIAMNILLDDHPMTIKNRASQWSGFDAQPRVPDGYRVVPEAIGRFPQNLPASFKTKHKQL